MTPPSSQTSDPFEEAIEAVKSVFRRHGMKRPQVVINAVWCGAHGGTFAAGTKIPSTYREMMAQSLEASYEETQL